MTDWEQQIIEDQAAEIARLTREKEGAVNEMERLARKCLTADADALQLLDVVARLTRENEALRAVLKDIMLHVPLYHENDDKHDRVHLALANARIALEQKVVP